jgi:hypothetical protein
MPKIQTSCPQCQQAIVAEIVQLIDVTQNPQLKESLLVGALNVAQCQVCGFVGQLPIPIVYHDTEKELLLTFSPPDANKTMEEKESELAPLLKRVIDNLEPEERKGYLFQPQAMLTMNNLVKNVLLNDGITEEMLQQQQEKMNLLDQLFTKEGDLLVQTVRENNQKIDREFFALFAEIAQRILMSQDEKTIEKIQEIQDALMSETDVGKEILIESHENQEARKSLEALGQNLTRESLIQLIVNAPNEQRLRAMASLVRPAMDYEFFQLFTEKIENTDDKNRSDLVDKRNLLLKYTQEIDQQIEEQLSAARKTLNNIIEDDNPEEALMSNLNSIDQFFIQVLSAELDKAIEQKQDERKVKLENILQQIQEITTPPELKVLDRLMSVVDDDGDLDAEIKELDNDLTQQLINYLTSIITQYEERIKSNSPEDLKDIEETLKKIKIVYNAVLKYSMKSKFST